MRRGLRVGMRWIWINCAAGKGGRVGSIVCLRAGPGAGRALEAFCVFDCLFGEREENGTFQDTNGIVTNSKSR